MADSEQPTPTHRPPFDHELEHIERRRAELHQRIEIDFRYHAPKPGQAVLYEELRARFRDLAHFMVDNITPGRELSRALSDLEDAVMHANSGIARSGIA